MIFEQCRAALRDGHNRHGAVVQGGGMKVVTYSKIT